MLILMGIYEESSLVSRPHPWGGKRVWWTWAESLVLCRGISTHQSDQSSGTFTWLAHRRNATWLDIHKGISQSQSDHSSGTVTWLAYRRNVTALLLAIRADQSDLNFSWPVGARHSTRTEDSAKVHQTFFPPWGWSLGTKLWRILTILFIIRLYKFVCGIMGDIYSLELCSLFSKFHKVEAGTSLFGCLFTFSISFREKEKERERRREGKMDSVWQLHGIQSNINILSLLYW